MGARFRILKLKIRTRGGMRFSLYKGTHFVARYRTRQAAMSFVKQFKKQRRPRRLTLNF